MIKALYSLCMAFAQLIVALYLIFLIAVDFVGDSVSTKTVIYAVALAAMSLSVRLDNLKSKITKEENKDLKIKELEEKLMKTQN